MTSHKNKFQWILRVLKLYQASFRPQWHKTRNQLQERIKNKNNMLLDNQWVTDKINEEIKKYLKTSEYENTMILSIWDTAKAVLWEKFITIQTYIRKQKRSQITNLTVTIMLIWRKSILLFWSPEGKETEI